MTEERWVFLKIVAAIIAVELIMVALGMGPEPLLVAALGGFLGAAGWFIRSLEGVARPGPPSPPAIGPDARVDNDPRVRSLRSGIMFSKIHNNYSERFQLNLIDLIDDQLAFAHGVDRRANPAAAARVLGPELSAFVDRDRSEQSTFDLDDLHRVVAGLEQL